MLLVPVLSAMSAMAAVICRRVYVRSVRFVYSVCMGYVQEAMSVMFAMSAVSGPTD